MNLDIKEIVKIITALGGFIAGLFLGLHVFYQLLIMFALMDIVVGILTGGKKGKLSSTISYLGMRKKAIMFILVGLSEILGRTLNAPIGVAVASFYLAHEGLSILENSIEAGLPIPDILRKAIAQFAEKE